MSYHCQQTRESIIMGLLVHRVGSLTRVTPRVRDLAGHFPHLAGVIDLYLYLLQGLAQSPCSGYVSGPRGLFSNLPLIQQIFNVLGSGNKVKIRMTVVCDRAEFTI